MEIITEEKVFCSECRHWLHNAYADGMWRNMKEFELAETLCTFMPQTVSSPIKEEVVYVKCGERNLRNDCRFFENVWEYRRKKKMEQDAADKVKKAIFAARWRERFRRLLFWRKK